MGYWIEDDSGFMGDFASVSGLGEFRRWAETLGGAVLSFVESGETDDPATLADTLDGNEAEGDVEELRKILLEMARGADGSLVLTDGTSGDDGTQDAPEEPQGQAADAEAGAELAAKDQPRAPKGSPGGGQWVAGPHSPDSRQWEESRWARVRRRVSREQQPGDKAWDHDVAPEPREGTEEWYLHAAGLRASEIQSVMTTLRAYVGSSYSEINGDVRDGNVTEAAQRLATFVAAMPKYKGDVYRGARIPTTVAEAMTPGFTYVATSFLSTSTSQETAGHFKGLPTAASGRVSVMFSLAKTATGVKLLAAGHNDENEVLFAPGSRFKVKSVRREYDATFDSWTFHVAASEITPRVKKGRRVAA